jgi:3-hydroxyisobutyrate dehydrogenase-like beta-hydroxyacid dehydrogenase
MTGIGFIGLAHMDFPITRRLLDAGHDVVAVGTRRQDTTLDHEGADSGFTSAITPIERAAGSNVGQAETGE